MDRRDGRLRGLMPPLILTIFVLVLASSGLVRADAMVGTGTPGSCTEAALNTALAAAGHVTFNCGANPVTITVTNQKTITANTSIDGANLITLSGGNTTRLFVVNSGTLTLANLTISDGAGDYGGAIFIIGALSVRNCTFSNNIASSSGGAIINGSSFSMLTVTDSTFKGNSASGNGGAIYNDGGPPMVTVTNSTFKDNSAGNVGGAIFNVSPPLTVTNSTFVGNSANGGGAFAGGTVTLKNTIVADSPTGGNCSGAITDGGHNLDSDGTCGVGPATDPLLAPAGLANNGGPTQTIALQAGSPAIDAGDNSACPATDQRGVPRQGAACDIGAYEFNSTPGSTPTPSGNTVCSTAGEGGSVTLSCASGVITTLDFASFGTPQGVCGAFTLGTCNAATSTSIVANACVGKSACTVPVNLNVFSDPCSGTPKQLAVQAECGPLGAAPTRTATRTNTPPPPNTQTRTPTIAATFTASLTPPATRTWTVAATPTLVPSTPTVPPSHTPTPQVSISIGTTAGARLQHVSFEVTLSTGGAPVAGTENDIGFDRINIPVAANADGEPDCAANPDINKGSSAFGFEPSGCSGDTCTGVRAVVLSFLNQDLIPDGAVLYTCTVVIAGNAPFTTFPLTISGVVASDAGGNVIPSAGSDGGVTVTAFPPTATPTLPPRPVIAVGSATDLPNHQVAFTASLQTNGAAVAGAQVDIAFDPSTPIDSINGSPFCSVNDSINKGSSSFDFQPAHCTPGVDCRAVRAIIISFSNVNPIPDGATLFTCLATIKRTAVAQPYTLTCSGAQGTDPSAHPIAATCSNGTITVLQPCPGDCDGSGDVTIDELLTGVNIAQDAEPFTQCPAFDTDRSGTVTIDELLRGVLNALNGCGGT